MTVLLCGLYMLVCVCVCIFEHVCACVCACAIIGAESAGDQRVPVRWRLTCA